MTSPKDSDLLSPNENRLLSPDDGTTKAKKVRAEFDIKSVANQMAVEKFREKHPELKDMSDLEICGVQTIMNAMVDQQVIFGFLKFHSIFMFRVEIKQMYKRTRAL